MAESSDVPEKQRLSSVVVASSHVQGSELGWGAMAQEP